ncbi:MAG: hypothetical protein J6U92_07540 [Clostridia bacterium]|nr:hypothetical protein [Clostridia bacterium]
MKITLSFILDAFFLAIISFFVCVIILNYFLRPPLTIIFSALLSLLFCALFTKRFSDKQRKNFSSIKEEREKQLIFTQLKLYTLTEQNDFFQKLIAKNGKVAERKKGGLFIKDTPAVVFPLFSFDGVRKTDIVRIFNTIKKEQTAYILADDFSKEVKDFAERFDGRIKTVEQNTLYQSLKENDLFPQTKHTFPERKKLTLSSLKNLLEKKKSKNFFMLGLVFIATSYFMPFKAYYIVCGTIFLIFSLILRLYGKNQTNPN